MPNNKPAYQRALEKVTDEPGECWIFAGATSGGYGRTGGERSSLAHRIVYEALVGPIPDGLTIDHLCRVRNCVNPEHLEPVTDRENWARGANFIADNLRKTECPRGHPYSGDNLYLTPSGRRDCRECKRAERRRRTAREKLT